MAAGCDLGAQREHQHTNGGQAHKHTPMGKQEGMGGTETYPWLLRRKMPVHEQTHHWTPFLRVNDGTF